MGAPDRERKRRIRRRTMVRLKLWFIRLGFIAAFVFLCHQIINIKTTYGSEYERKAMWQLINSGTESDKVIAPNRGTIMDRNKRGLAVSTTVYNIYLDIRVLVQKSSEVQEDTLAKINQVLGIPLETLRSYIAMDETGKKPLIDRNVYYLEKQVPYVKGKELEALKPACVYLEEDSKRSYPYNNLASSTIGFIRGGASWGIESQYNRQLSGIEGRIFKAYDSNGTITTNRYDAEEGSTIITTLDLKMQQDAERLSEKYGKMYEGVNASMIVMDPNTGELLAMAQYPTINLNDPTDILSINNEIYAEEWPKLTQEQQINLMYEKYIWPNFNVTAMFEPGSIFKPVTVAAALEEGIITLNDTFYCSGYRTYAGWDIYCHKRTGHGTQTLDESLANSCNVAMMIIAERMGRDMFYKYLTDFGYGSKTGIDLPAEALGVRHSVSELNASELATSSFGQRFKCTPIQAITSFAAVINGGNMLRPYIVSQIVDAKGNIVVNNQPVIERKVISKETSDYIRESLEKVLSPTGTGRNAAIEGYAIGGKTGTGEQGIKDTDPYSYALSFIAYLPVDNPQYLVQAIIDQVPKKYIDDHTGTASKMMQDMLNEIIKDKGIQPSYNIAQPKFSPDDGMFAVEDYVGMNITDVTKQLNQRGINYEFLGGGGAVVASQVPAAGTRVTKKVVIMLTLSNGDEYGLVQVPDVAGFTLADAEKILSSHGFETVVALEQNQEETPSDNPPAVYEQVPEAGFKIVEGAQVKIRGR